MLPCLSWLLANNLCSQIPFSYRFLINSGSLCRDCIRYDVKRLGSREYNIDNTPDPASVGFICIEIYVICEKWLSKNFVRAILHPRMSQLN